MNQTKVLVCGATGFIGRNLVQRLACRTDLEVYGTYLRKPPADVDAPIQWQQVDLTNADQVHALIAGKDIVIQAAAVTSGAKDIITQPYIHTTDNAVMNSLILRACFDHKVQHFVFFSCTVMYPSSDSPVREEDFDGQIIDRYFGSGWTKVYIEKMCEFYARISTMKTTAIRHSNIYGPYDKYDLEHSHVFGATMTKVLTADQAITVWGDGTETRDLLYVSDLVDFVETIIASQTQPFELINIGSGEAISVKDLVEKLIKQSGKDLHINFDTSKPTIPFHLSLNIAKAYERYRWRPQVPLDEGIQRTLHWYVQHYKPDA